MIVSPFKTIGSKDIKSRMVTLKGYKSLQQQNNFTNKILGTLSSQLDRIEDKLEMPKTNSQITIPQFLNRNLDKNCPIFKHAEVGKETSKLSKLK